MNIANLQLEGLHLAFSDINNALAEKVERSELSPREPAVSFTDKTSHFVWEASV
jgi:hypothetical protein